MKSILSIITIGLLLMTVSTQLFAQKMKKKTRLVEVAITIDAPAEKVWEAMVVDYGNIANFSPYIYKSDYCAGSTKGEEGAERTCSLSENGKRWVQERIAHIDEEKMMMRNLPVKGEKMPLDFEHSYALYAVKDNGDGTSTASYTFHFRTKPAIMGFMAQGGFKKTLKGTLIGLKHYVETGEKVNPENDRYKQIKKNYNEALVAK
jgi:hypothetical protein